MAIDYGTRRIGLAITDPLHMFASPLLTINTKDFDSYIEDYLKKESIEAFVIGYPVQMNNMPSESVKSLNPFIKKIRNKFPDMPVHLVDERFTSQMAIRTIIEGGVRKKDRMDKSMVDKISASIILQSFLDSRPHKNEKEIL